MTTLKSRIKTAVEGGCLSFLSPLLEKVRVSRQQHAAARVERAVRQGAVTFVSFETASRWTRDWNRDLPAAVDLFVGVPRSGLVFAGMAALAHGKPLTTPDSLSDGTFWLSEQIAPPARIRTILIVEDSVDTGKSLREAKAAVEAAMPDATVMTAALIGRPGGTQAADFVYTTVPQPRFFEWDLSHQKKVARLAMTSDAILGLGRIPSYRVDICIAKEPGPVAEQLTALGVDCAEIIPGEGDWPVRLQAAQIDLLLSGTAADAEKALKEGGITAIALDEMSLFAAAGEQPA